MRNLSIVSTEPSTKLGQNEELGFYWSASCQLSNRNILKIDCTNPILTHFKLWCKFYEKGKARTTTETVNQIGNLVQRARLRTQHRQQTFYETCKKVSHVGVKRPYKHSILVVRFIICLQTETKELLSMRAHCFSCSAKADLPLFGRLKVSSTRALILDFSSGNIKIGNQKSSLRALRGLTLSHSIGERSNIMRKESIGMEGRDSFPGKTTAQILQLKQET